MFSGTSRNGTTDSDNIAPESLNEQTKKLFKAIDEGNLENFEQALRDGANVNVFDQEGCTPFMSLANVYTIGSGQFTLIKMAKLLVQYKNIDINIQSRQPVYEQRQKRDQYNRSIYLVNGREVVQDYQEYIYCDDQQPVVFNEDYTVYLNSRYDGVMESVRTDKMQKNTILHIACQYGTQDVVKILLTHPDININLENDEKKTPENCIGRGSEGIIKKEIQKAHQGKQLLNALSFRNIIQAKALLNQEFNPNCWKRNQNGEIETPLSLILKLCLRERAEDKKEILIKLLKHKDLDFSQTKPMPELDGNYELKQIIEQALKEQLIATINSNDLDDVKTLVEDNCLMDHAIVIGALSESNNPINESINGYLSCKFAASTEHIYNDEAEANGDHDLARELQQLEDIKGEIARIKAELTSTNTQLKRKDRELKRVQHELDNQTLTQQREIVQLTREKTQLSSQKQQLEGELASTKTQLEEKDRELRRVRDELYDKTLTLGENDEELGRLRQHLNDKNNNILWLNEELIQKSQENLSQGTQLNSKIQDLINRNKKLTEASTQSRIYGNRASASFVTSGAFAASACLTMPDLAICIPLASVALIFFAVGCYCSYKANTALEHITNEQFIGNSPRISAHG